jgi:hypothetical protein
MWKYIIPKNMKTRITEPSTISVEETTNGGHLEH